jgi:hypothetical protein
MVDLYSQKRVVWQNFTASPVAAENSNQNQSSHFFLTNKPN